MLSLSNSSSNYWALQALEEEEARLWEEQLQVAMHEADAARRRCRFLLETRTAQHRLMHCSCCMSLHEERGMEPLGSGDASPLLMPAVLATAGQSLLQPCIKQAMRRPFKVMDPHTLPKP